MIQHSYIVIVNSYVILLSNLLFYYSPDLLNSNLIWMNRCIHGKEVFTVGQASSANPQRVIDEKSYQRYNLPLKPPQNTLQIKQAKHKISYSQIFLSNVSLRKTVNQSLGLKCQKSAHHRTKTQNIQLNEISSQSTISISKPLLESKKDKNAQSDAILMKGKGNKTFEKNNCKDSKKIAQQIDLYSINTLIKEKLRHKAAQKQIKLKQQERKSKEQCNAKETFDLLVQANQKIELELKNTNLDETFMSKNKEIGTKTGYHSMRQVEDLSATLPTRVKISKENGMKNQIISIYHTYTMNLTKLLNMKEEIQKNKERELKLKKTKEESKILDKIIELEDKNMKMTNLLNKMKQKGIDVDSFWTQ